MRARQGRKKTFLFSAAVIILTAWPIFDLVKTGELWLIVLGAVYRCWLSAVALLTHRHFIYFRRQSTTFVECWSAPRRRP